MRDTVIIFDVNETLLDMEPVKQSVNRSMDSKRGFKVWFNMLLHYSLVENCTEQFHPFSELAEATLDMAATSLGVHLKMTDKQGILKSMKTLEAHSDVKKALTILKDDGFRLGALTNSSADTLAAQLEYAGIKDYFEATLSVDAVRKYKPSGECYAYAAHKFSVQPDKMLMIAAHGWDIAGAGRAGLNTCFIEREGQALYPLSAKPSFSGKKLTDVTSDIREKLS
jgi:2-haloacid dehalogenase